MTTVWIYVDTKTEVGDADHHRLEENLVHLPYWINITIRATENGAAARRYGKAS